MFVVYTFVLNLAEEADFCDEKDPSECAGRRPLSHFAPSEIPSTPPTPPSPPLPRNQALAGPAASSGPQLCGSAGRGFARSCFWSPSTRWSRSRSTPTTWWTPTWPAGGQSFKYSDQPENTLMASSWAFELTTALFWNSMGGDQQTRRSIQLCWWSDKMWATSVLCPDQSNCLFCEGCLFAYALYANCHWMMQLQLRKTTDMKTH